VENLGVEGLAQYLERSREAPALVLVSDLSAVPEPPTMWHAWQKPSLWRAANHALDVTYQALHSRIYHIYSGGQYEQIASASDDTERRIAAYVVQASSFWSWAKEDAKVKVILLRPVARHEGWHFADADLDRIKRVRRLGTLDELAPDEINDCVYVGARIVAAYLTEICKTVGLTGTQCRPIDLSKLPRCAS
jgi:hypothetical protein